MPSEKQHLAKAKYNEGFFESIKYEYSDWSITGLFYSSLHFIEAFLATKGIHVEDHKERAKMVGIIKELKPLFGCYRALYDYSVNARYKMHNFSVEAINQSYKDFFLPIKKEITKLLTK
jgi:hypothetical protein